MSALCAFRARMRRRTMSPRISLILDSDFSESTFTFAFISSRMLCSLPIFSTSISFAFIFPLASSFWYWSLLARMSGSISLRKCSRYASTSTSFRFCAVFSFGFRLTSFILTSCSWSIRSSVAVKLNSAAVSVEASLTIRS